MPPLNTDRAPDREPQASPEAFAIDPPPVPETGMAPSSPAGKGTVADKPFRVTEAPDSPAVDPSEPSPSFAPLAAPLPDTAEAATLPPPVPPAPAVSSETETLSPGSALARPEAVSSLTVSVPGYEILEELGRGGMGVVYRARHTKLNRVVALKMILSGAHAGPDDLARFRIEAEAIARLQHPNIVQVFEVGEQGGLPYFSLEFCGGGSLEQKLASTPLPPSVAAELVETLARAMQAAHERHVIHRDLKPANVLLAEDGTPKITDFGLAKKLDAVGQTASGVVMGTPSYMAPEQAGYKPAAQARDIGPAVDVYALGAILYQCLTGRPPFKAATALDTILQVVSDEPVAPTRLHSRTPRDLETICLKCLEKEPRNRYSSALALAEDVHRFLAGEPIRARPSSHWERGLKWAKRRPAVAALLAVSAVALVAVLGGGTAFTLRLHEFTVRLQDQFRETQQARDDADDKAAQLTLQVQATDNARKVAEGKEQEARFNQYVAQMNLVQREYEANNIVRVRELLDAQVPRVPGATDFRNFECHYWHHLMHQELRTFTGHRSGVLDVAFSPDGTRLASASKDGTAKLWAITTGQELCTLKKHMGPVWGVAFGPDGKRLASAGGDKTVRLWDADTGQELLCLRRHTTVVTSVVFSPDGTRLASVDGDGVIKVWDSRSGQERRSFRAHERGGAWRVAYSRDGQRLASVSFDGTVKVWDSGTGENLLTLSHPSYVTGVAFSPDGTRLASASLDGIVRVWDSRTRRELLSLGDQRSWIMGVAFRPDVAFSPDGKRLASTSENQSVRIWDSGTGQELVSLKGHTSFALRVAFSPDGQRLASASEDRTVKLWDSGTGQTLLILQGHTGIVNGLAFRRDSLRLATSSQDGTVKVWDSGTGEALLSFKKRGVIGVTFDPDGRRVASISDDGSVEFWDSSTGQELPSLKRHTAPLASVAFSPDGKRVATAAGDASVQRALMNQQLGLPSPRGHHPIKLWDSSTGQELLSLKGHAYRLSSMAFSPDGQRLASGGFDQTVKLWDGSTGQELRTFEGHEGLVTAVAFSPDGLRLASTGFDQTVRIWDSGTGQPVLCLKGHPSAVLGVAFNPDGTRLASASEDGSVKLWDSGTGQELLSLKAAAGVGWGVAFSPDGQRLAIAGRDNLVKVWESCSVPAQVLREREAALRRHELIAHVRSLYAKHLFRPDVLASLRQDATLSQSERGFALQVAQTHPEDPGQLNGAAWKVVKTRDADKDAYALALRRAEAGVRLAPQDGNILNTLGVAQYRTSRYAEALATLTQAEKLNATKDGPNPSDLAFLAMAQHQLGKKAEANATLGRLREAMKQRLWAKDAEAQDFLREAEELIEGKRAGRKG
jgi:WD40 repeat protein/tRNA A-37 threonylcarbamoyl transferase component Bud32